MRAVGVRARTARLIRCCCGARPSTGRSSGGPGNAPSALLGPIRMLVASYVLRRQMCRAAQTARGPPPPLPARVRRASRRREACLARSLVFFSRCSRGAARGSSSSPDLASEGGQPFDTRANTTRYSRPRTSSISSLLVVPGSPSRPRRGRGSCPRAVCASRHVCNLKSYELTSDPMGPSSATQVARCLVPEVLTRTGRHPHARRIRSAVRARA